MEDFIKERAEQGDAEMQWLLGGCYASGEDVPQDYQKAVYWYQKSADQGNMMAIAALGQCHMRGEGTPQDYKKALFWLQIAADHGSPLGQMGLGRCYLEGKDIRDEKKGTYWFMKGLKGMEESVEKLKALTEVLKSKE